MDLAQLKQAYEIQRELGRGGMGIVFQAKDRRLERYVALKILNLTEGKDSAQGKRIVERFLKEAKAIARLNHPHIVTLYDIGECNGRYFLVLEYVDGLSLEALQQRQGNLSPEQLVPLALQLCDALDYAHRQGIVHRDIKPANVLLNQEGQLKLMDFGIAQIEQDVGKQTQAGELLGSVLYMSPEQLSDASQVDARSDIYSLGMTLYELLSGHLPFNGSNIGEVIRKVLMSEAPNFSSLGIEVPAPLADIIYRALLKDPQKRFASALEMKQALLRLGPQTVQMNPFVEPLLVNKVLPASDADISAFIMQTLMIAEQEEL